MLYYCAYTWHPGTSYQQVIRRIGEQASTTDATQDSRIRDWYALAGGGAGYLVIEVDDPRELTQLLQPYMDLMAWDVRTIYPVDREAIRAASQHGGR